MAIPCWGRFHQQVAALLYRWDTLQFESDFAFHESHVCALNPSGILVGSLLEMMTWILNDRTSYCVYDPFHHFHWHHHIDLSTLNVSDHGGYVYDQEKENDCNHHYGYDGVYYGNGGGLRQKNLSRNFVDFDRCASVLYDDPVNRAKGET